MDFQPRWQGLLPVYDPQLCKTYVWGPFPPGAGGGVCVWILQKWHLALWQAQAEPRAWSRLGIGIPVVFGAIWVPFGIPFLFGAHLGTIIWGPIWRPKADIMEAEGRLNGGLGAETPGV